MSTPTPEQLAAAPELAILAALEAALGIAIVALAAAWPELNDPEDNPLVDEPYAALDVIDHARRLYAAINRYRLALATAHRSESDLPF